MSRGSRKAVRWYAFRRPDENYSWYGMMKENYVKSAICSEFETPSFVPQLSRPIVQDQNAYQQRLKRRREKKRRVPVISLKKPKRKSTRSRRKPKNLSIYYGGSISKFGQEVNRLLKAH